MGRMRNKLYLGEVVRYPIVYEDITLLERSLPEEQDEPNFTKGRKTCSHESYDDCIYTMLDRVMRGSTEDNCTVPWLPTNDNICTAPADINTTYWILKARAENSARDCNMPCHFVSVRIDGKDNDQRNDYDPNYAILYLYYPSSVLQSREHFVYNIDSLFGYVGGYVGFILGQALLDIFFWMDNKVGSMLR